MSDGVRDRRRLLAAGAAWLAAPWLPGAAVAAPGGLPAAQSLRSELAAAALRRRALVVMVSLERCPFCKIVRENYLLPLLRDGQPVVQLDMASTQGLADFAGAATTHDALVRSLGVRVAPTVLFFGAGGREAAARLEGMPLVDFYGAYLDQRVQSANRTQA
jgi:hypothetical protein